MKKKPPLHRKHHVFTTNTSGLILFTETINVYCGNYNYLSTYLRTPWSRVLLQKLTSFQPIKKFPALHGTRRFITALQEHATCPCAEPDQSSPCPTTQFLNIHHMVRHSRCVVINYNWINQLSSTTIWWLDICCLLHRYQLHVSALMAIFRLID